MRIDARLVASFLLGVTVFSLLGYALSLKEKYQLKEELSQVKTKVVALESEKQNLLQELEKEKAFQERLSQENSSLNAQLEESKKRLEKLVDKYAEAAKKLNELQSQLSLLLKSKETPLAKPVEIEVKPALEQ